MTLNKTLYGYYYLAEGKNYSVLLLAGNENHIGENTKPTEKVKKIGQKTEKFKYKRCFNIKMYCRS